MTERERMLGQEPIVPLFFKFSIPAIMGMIVQALYNMVDRFFISNIPEIGSMAIGGVGITLPITFILMGFTMLFGIGAGANISLKMGEGKPKQAEHILANAFIMLTLVAWLLCAIFFIDLDGILRVFGATESNLVYAREYIFWIIIGNLWNTYAFAMNHMIRAEGSPKWSMMSMFIGAGANIILDPIFIFDQIPLLNLPGLGMGVKGAAYATIIAQALSFLWGAYYYASGRSNLKPKREMFKISPTVVRMIVAIGISPFAIQVAGAAVGALFNNSLKLYGGELGQGAYAIGNSIATLFYMPTFGMNQGLQPIIGFNYGAKQYHRVKKATVTGIIAALCVTTLGWVLIQFFPAMLVTPMAREDLALRNLTIDGLKKRELLMIVVAIQVISANFFSSIGKAKISFFLSLSRQVLILIPVLLILPKFWGLDGIWYALPISDVLATLMSVFFILREFRKLDHAQGALERAS